MLAAASIEAQPVRYVLLLQSLDRGNVIIDSLTGDLRIDLDRLAGTHIALRAYDACSAGDEFNARTFFDQLAAEAR